MLQRGRWWSAGAVVIALLGLYLYLDAYVWLTPVEKINRRLEDARRAVAEESIFTLRELLAMDYRDASGLGKQEVIGLLFRFFQQAEDLQLSYPYIKHKDPELSADADEAEVLVVVQVTGRRSPGGERFSGIDETRANAFLVRFHKQEDEWRVVHTRRLEGSNPQALLNQLRSSGVF